ncbi:DUF3024 domain-containing protein [Kutzneria sp. NPDC052558]|uniref:DUF3024 domain-containing protein n=1 Tax=Kutzneria sp. NPDC052558 TaxID=3364121 RepID=UPI0037CA1185
MAVPEIHLKQIARWCAQRVPERVRDQVRIEHSTRGSNVTIFELWQPDLGDEWSRRAIAQLRYDGSSWRLYWPDRNTRWHLLPEVPAATTPGPLLAEFDNPARPFD